MGWFRSPGGVLAHADGPSQQRSYEGRGYTPVSDADAKAEIGKGIRLAVSASDTAGTFDDDTVRAAVRDESPRTQAHREAVAHAKRSAAARKGAETKARKAAEAEQQQDTGDSDKAPDSEG